MESGIIIGVDPGSDGAFAIMEDGEIIETMVFPKTKVQSKKASKTREGEFKKDKSGKRIYAMKEVLDEDELINMVYNLKDKYPDATVILEKVKNIMGSGAMQNFNFGYNFGFISALVNANFSRVVLTTPQNWQKHVIWAVDKVLKPDESNDTKATSLNALKRLFPDLDLRATPRSTKFHDGLTDSVLIAWYGYKEILKGDRVRGQIIPLKPTIQADFIPKTQTFNLFYLSNLIKNDLDLF